MLKLIVLVTVGLVGAAVAATAADETQIALPFSVLDLPLNVGGER